MGNVVVLKSRTGRFIAYHPDKPGASGVGRTQKEALKELLEREKNLDARPKTPEAR